MKTRVQFDLNPKEFEVVKNSLFNYRGKLIYQRNHANYEMTFEECKRVERELQLINSMIKEFSHDEEVR